MKIGVGVRMGKVGVVIRKRPWSSGSKGPTRNNGKLIPKDWDPTHVSENWGGKRPAQIFGLLSSARSTFSGAVTPEEDRGTTRLRS